MIFICHLKFNGGSKFVTFHYSLFPFYVSVQPRKLFPDTKVYPIMKKGKQIYKRPVSSFRMNRKEVCECFFETCFAHVFLVLMYLVDKESPVCSIDVGFHTKILIGPVQQILVSPQLTLCYLSWIIGWNVLWTLTPFHPCMRHCT